MGRKPRDAEAGPALANLNVRVTPAELAQVDAECERLGMSRPDLLRHLFTRAGVFGGGPRPAMEANGALIGRGIVGPPPVRSSGIASDGCPHLSKDVKRGASGLLICQACKTQVKR